MMSPRDALRSYRRAFKRAYPLRGPALGPTHPLQVEMGRRGDRLQVVFGGYDIHGEWPLEVVEAMTTRDLDELVRMDEEGDDVCVF